MGINRYASAAFGLGRVAFGAYALARPSELGATWIGKRPAGRKPVTVILRALGVRDVALGAGTVAASFTGHHAPWLAAGVAADLGDLTATLAGRDYLPEEGVRGTVVLTAVASAAGAALILSRAAGARSESADRP